MSSLGIRLREIRLAKGVSLDDIARSTRVGRRHLEALETDSWGELPAPVFVKGFIRAYCESLDASPDEALELSRGAAGAPGKLGRAQRPVPPPPPRRAGPLMVSLVLFIALGASLFALRIGLKSSPRPGAAVSGPALGDAGSVASPAPIPVTTGPAVPVQPAPVPAGEPKPAGQRLLIRAVEPTWIRVQVDEGQVAEELLQAGAGRGGGGARPAGPPRGRGGGG